MVRRTKIVATVGPASSSVESLRGLIEAGMNLARVTLAHGTLESQRELITRIRTVADEMNKSVGILVDLPGPKVRTTVIEGEIKLARDHILRMVPGEDEPSTAEQLVVEYPSLLEDLEVGDTISIGDGIVHVVVEEESKDSLRVRVTHGGTLTGRKGVKIPTEHFHADVPTDEDIEFIKALSDMEIDVLAVSFVRNADDMRAVRKIVGHEGPWLMAKIETAPAVENLAEIITVSDAVMVARGDLGSELPIEEVPHLQKQIIKATVRQGKPVLVATQMLESMIEAPSPTRAEASDVANAVLDYASALMLSAETAIGRDPELVVRTMDRIIRRTEDALDIVSLQRFAQEDRDLNDVNTATAHAAWQAANDINADAILCCTRTGSTARKMSSFRPLIPLYGLTAQPTALRRLALCWGVQPLYSPVVETSTEEVVNGAITTAKENGVVKTGDVVVVLAGSPSAGPGHTDSVRVCTVS